jgi:hypothetical protein
LTSFLFSFNSHYRLNKYIANKLIYYVDPDNKDKISFNYRRKINDLKNNKDKDFNINLNKAMTNQ